MRDLLIMRHAKSNWNNKTQNDFDRPLSERGQRNATRIGYWLLEHSLIPDWIVSSPALRASETVLHVCQALGIRKAQIHWEPAVYEAELKPLLKVLACCPEDKQLTLLVGHNPGLEELLQYLVGGNTTVAMNEKIMPTAAIAHLELPDDWRALTCGAGRLKTLMHPKVLPEL
jgi:phosphohistidine phosphatase